MYHVSYWQGENTQKLIHILKQIVSKIDTLMHWNLYSLGPWDLKLGIWTHIFIFQNDDDTLITSESCGVPVSVWLLARHGTRFPSGKAMGPMRRSLLSLFSSDRSSGSSSVCLSLCLYVCANCEFFTQSSFNQLAVDQNFQHSSF